MHEGTPAPDEPPEVVPRLLLWPLAAFADASPGPATARVLARADRARDVPGWRAQLQRAFRLMPARVPVAALTRQLDRGDAAQHQWLRADPAHVRADMATARLMACGELDLSQAEADALLRPLKPLFGDAGCLLDAPVPQRWYVMLPREVRLPEFVDPQQAMGDALDAHLPPGEPGRRWRQLLNEAQIVLHNHPVNAERVRAGKLPVNSVWFWGAGALPDQAASTFATVHTSDVLLSALARCGGCDVQAPLQDATALVGASVPALLDLRELRDAGALEQRWIAPLLASRRTFELDFGDGELLVVRPAHRWRLWRRPASSFR